MKTFTNAFVGVICAAILCAGLVTYFCQDDWCFVFPWQHGPAPLSFAECVEKGYPVFKKNPRQCRIGALVFTEGPSTQPFYSESVIVTSPLPNATVQSPLTITGEAKGTWFFEGSFPVRLLDANKKEIGRTIAQAKGEWMTQNFVSFSASLNFTSPKTKTGLLIFAKDNPSGLSSNDAQVSFPVTFEK